MPNERLYTGDGQVDIQCDVIVLTWDHLDLTKKFFDSFWENTPPSVRVIVVDNASTDGTPAYLREMKAHPVNGPRIEVVFNGENKGFVRGVNQGFALSRAPYICLANNDLVFTKGWLDEIMTLFGQYPSLGILNPNSNTLGVRPAQGESLEDFSASLRDKNAGQLCEMPFCSGFCMVLKRDILDKNSGLSPEYIPMFFEDTDISMKAKELGYLIGVAKGAYVWHREHGSFKEGSKIDKIFQKSRMAFEKKWGRTLRIAWIVDHEKDLAPALQQALKTGLQNHFVTFYVKGHDIRREEIFKALGVFEHSAIQFKKFCLYVPLCLRLIFKKKKFDLVIVKGRVLRLMFGLLRQKAIVGLASLDGDFFKRTQSLR